MIYLICKFYFIGLILSLQKVPLPLQKVPLQLQKVPLPLQKVPLQLQQVLKMMMIRLQTGQVINRTYLLKNTMMMMKVMTISTAEMMTRNPTVGVLKATIGCIHANITFEC